MLNDLNLKPGYTTEKDNISEVFFNPCLSESISYDRVAGYFSSSSLKYLTKGIQNLISKNGKYRLIISDEISEKDYNAIKEGYYNREHLIDETMEKLNLEKYKSLEDKQNLANLAYLITIGLVDIKIGFILDGLFHAKFGIMSDKEDNLIYFTGSANETENAMINNYENIDIKKSWIHQSEKEYILEKQKYFNELWNGVHKSRILYVTELNDRIKYKIKENNKGGLVIDKQIFEEKSIVLLLDNNRLKLINNLEEKLAKSRQIDRLVRKYDLDTETLYFKNNLNYKDVEYIIAQLLEHEKRRKQRVVIGDSVYKYIESSKFEINEVSKMGLLIKSQDNSIVNYMNQFNKIVDKEFSDKYSLRSIQKWVSYYMTRMNRVANFSVPGSGKTAMVYGTFAYLSSLEIDEVSQIIMIGPKNSFLSWKDEFNKFFEGKRQLKVLDIHAPGFLEEDFIRSPKSYDLILVNYESLPKYRKYLEKIVDSRSMLVFDEVHKIKNPESLRASCAIDLAAKAKYRYVLTGTPIPNTYLDIWNLLHILYDDEYTDYFDMSKQELSSADILDQEKLNEKLAPFFWRVTKDDLNIPNALPDNIYKLRASDQEQAILNLLWKKYRHVPLKLYIRLIQFSSNPQLLSSNIVRSMFFDNSECHDNENKKDDMLFEFEDEMEDDIRDLYSADEIALLNSVKTTRKFEAAMNKVNDLVSQRKTVIVWCIFVDTIQKVVRYCRDRGHDVMYIDGSVHSQDRESIIKNFQNRDFDVLVTNPHTLAESVSLHTACHDAIYLEYSFNLTHMLQSRDRIHRYGLKPEETTSYYYFMLEGQEGACNTIDEKIYNRLKEKEETMLRAIETDLLVPEYSENEKDEIFNMMCEEINKKK